MDIGTERTGRIVNVGSATDLYALYSTAATLMKLRARKVALGLTFLEYGSCRSRDCTIAARQLEEISDVLAAHPPTDAIWDIAHPEVPAPWTGNLAPEITSCADLFTTSEGELLLPELIALLQYGGSVKQDIIVLG